MTIYFYLSSTPSNIQLSKVFSLSFFDKEAITITNEITLGNEIRVNITTDQQIYSIDVLIRIQELLKEIFNISTVFVR